MAYQGHPADLTEENLYNISMRGHHRTKPHDPIHEGPTLPQPISSPHGSHHSTIHSRHSMHSNMSTQTITAELPQEDITHPSGIPALASYRDGVLTDPRLRYNVPAAAKTVTIKHDQSLWERRNALLQIYAESFPGDSTHFGPPNTIVSGVYDSIPGLEQLVDKTLQGIQVKFDIGGCPTIGYYLDFPMYLKLHQELSKINDQWAPILLRITGQPIPVPCWYRFSMPGQVWPGIEFETYAVKFREELESFLSLIY